MKLSTMTIVSCARFESHGAGVYVGAAAEVDVKSPEELKDENTELADPSRPTVERYCPRAKGRQRALVIRSSCILDESARRIICRR